MIYLLVPFGDVFCFFRCKKITPYMDPDLRVPSKHPPAAEPAIGEAVQTESVLQTEELIREPSPELAFGYDCSPDQEETKTNDEEKKDENDQQ